MTGLMCAVAGGALGITLALYSVADAIRRLASALHDPPLGSSGGLGAIARAIRDTRHR